MLKPTFISVIFLLVLNLFFAIILIYLFAKDKISFNKRIIEKHKGFLLEKTHIFLFELLEEKIGKIITIVDEKIIQNLTLIFVYLVNFAIKLSTLKIARIKVFKNIKNVLIIFIILVLTAIFIALFGRFKC